MDQANSSSSTDSISTEKLLKEEGKLMVVEARNSNIKNERRSPVDNGEDIVTRRNNCSAELKHDMTAKYFKKRRSPKVTEKQQQIFMDFMEKYPDFCRGKLTGLDKDKLWDMLVQMLNEAGVGPAKGVEKWKKTWADWKSGVKTKALRIRREQNSHGNHNNHHVGFEYLSPLEERMVVVAGWISTANESKDFTCDESTVEETVVGIRHSGKQEMKQVVEKCNEATYTLLKPPEEQLVIPCFPENVTTNMRGDFNDDRDGSSPAPNHFYMPSSSNQTSSCAISHEVPITSTHHFMNQRQRDETVRQILLTQVPTYEDSEEKAGEDIKRGGSPASSSQGPKSSEGESPPSNFMEVQRQHAAALAGIKRHLGTIALAQKRRAAAAERKASAMENIVAILDNFLNK